MFKAVTVLLHSHLLGICNPRLQSQILLLGIFGEVIEHDHPRILSGQHWNKMLIHHAPPLSVVSLVQQVRNTFSIQLTNFGQTFTPVGNYTFTFITITEHTLWNQDDGDTTQQSLAKHQHWTSHRSSVWTWSIWHFFWCRFSWNSSLRTRESLTNALPRLMDNFIVNIF